jgi:P27 family predicted phage terminase small subunit
MKNNGFPKAPKTLSREARSWWTRLQKEYSLDDEAARFLLETALTAFDRMRQAQQAIAENGVTVRDKWDQLKINPAVNAERDARSGMLAAFKALNLDVEPLRDGVGRPPGR